MNGVRIIELTVTAKAGWKRVRTFPATKLVSTKKTAHNMREMGHTVRLRWIDAAAVPAKAVRLAELRRTMEAHRDEDPEGFSQSLAAGTYDELGEE